MAPNDPGDSAALEALFALTGEVPPLTLAHPTDEIVALYGERYRCAEILVFPGDLTLHEPGPVFLVASDAVADPQGAAEALAQIVVDRLACEHPKVSRRVDTLHEALTLSTPVERWRVGFVRLATPWIDAAAFSLSEPLEFPNWFEPRASSPRPGTFPPELEGRLRALSARALRALTQGPLPRWVHDREIWVPGDDPEEMGRVHAIFDGSDLLEVLDWSFSTELLIERFILDPTVRWGGAWVARGRHSSEDLYVGTGVTWDGDALLLVVTADHANPVPMAAAMLWTPAEWAPRASRASWSLQAIRWHLPRRIPVYPTAYAGDTWARAQYREWRTVTHTVSIQAIRDLLRGPAGE